jgi:hypothetical protein
MAVSERRFRPKSAINVAFHCRSAAFASQTLVTKRRAIIKRFKYLAWFSASQVLLLVAA